MKKVSLVFVLVCLALCLTPSVGMVLLGPAGPGANEVLSAPPALREETGGVNMAFPSQLADYVADHFFLRQEFITAGRRLEAAAFGSSGEDDVVLGRDGWLFYASTVDDYTGLRGLTDRELYAAARNLALLKEACTAAGVDFLFTAAPNKNSLYGGYMPDLGAAAGAHDVQKLYGLLDEMGVSYLDLAAAFADRDEVLYFAHDSHWNSRGAALAADAVNAALGQPSGYYDGQFTPAPHSGDLYGMLYPAAADTEQDLVYTPALTLTYETENVRPDSITIVARGRGERRLFAYRDSFGNNLYPYLADSSAWAQFSRATAYDLPQVLAAGADTLLIELVERNLDYLVDHPPILSAPARSAGPAADSGDALAVSAAGAESPAGCVRIEGSTPAGIDDRSPVYVRCDGGDFEALLSRDGFAAYVPGGDAPRQVLAYRDGVLTAWDAAVS